MDNSYNKIGIFSGSTLKILACLFMVIDHVGLTFYQCDPELFAFFRILGRLSFPLFAFFIAEGTRYSKHRLRRLALIASIGSSFFLFYLFYSGDLYGNIFLTFTISILLDIFLFETKKSAFAKPNSFWWIIMLAVFVISLLLLYQLYSVFRFEYGFYGMLLPVLINIFNFKDINVPKIIKKLDNHWIRIFFLVLGSILLSIDGNLGDIQFYCLFAVIPLALYNGKVGCRKLKYAFYIFYPAHLVVIEGIAVLISHIS